MKIIHVNTYLNIGGAAIAVNRINNSLNEIKGSKSIIISKSFFNSNFLYIFCRKIKTFISIIIRNIASSKSKISPTDFALLPSMIHRDINNFKPDIVNLHWINSEFISLDSIKKINSKIIWTLHDTWPLNGSQHYNLEKNINYNFRLKKSSFQYKFFENINKRRLNNLYKNKKITFICPSKWILQEWSKSNVSKYTQAFHVPNPLDLNIFKPKNKNFYRNKFKLPENKILIFFGAEKANLNFRKGFHLLEKVLFNLKNSNKNIELVTVGFSNNVEILIKDFKVYNFGRINSDKEMSEIYSCCDLIVIPSLVDNLPQIATEAVSCGLPAIAFDIGGLSDIITNKKNGYLISPFDTNLMAKKIKLLSEDRKKMNIFSDFSREFALKNWSSKIISEKYIDIFSKI